jgi:hypothetical protein
VIGRGLGVGPVINGAVSGRAAGTLVGVEAVVAGAAALCDGRRSTATTSATTASAANPSAYERQGPPLRPASGRSGGPPSSHSISPSSGCSVTRWIVPANSCRGDTDRRPAPPLCARNLAAARRVS